jgi:hypothetical protein
MKQLLCTILLLVCLPLAAQNPSGRSQLSDEQVKQEVIRESIESYPGNCPCPENRASNGSRCGKRSAWSKAGGYAPICYENEVSKEMIEAWRNRNKS